MGMLLIPVLYKTTVDNDILAAKKAASLYYSGKRTKDWIKFKRMADEERELPIMVRAAWC